MTSAAVWRPSLSQPFRVDLKVDSKSEVGQDSEVAKSTKSVVAAIPAVNSLERKTNTIFVFTSKMLRRMSLHLGMRMMSFSIGE